MPDKPRLPTWSKGDYLNDSKTTVDVCDFANISKLSQLDQLMAFPEHAEYACNLEFTVPKCNNVCIFAVGESTTSGEIVSAYADYNSDHQISMISDGRIPGWINSDTTVIIVSYSGNNEVLSVVYNEILERGSTLYCITSGGYLEEVCKRDGNTFIKLPSGLSARSATGYEFGLLASLIQSMGVCNIKDALLQSIPTLKSYRDGINDHPFKIELYKKISDNIIAVYSTAELRASYKRWRISFNQDAGCPSFCGDIPEFDHNELVGWANHNQSINDLKIVILKCENESPVLEKIIDSMTSVLEEYGREVIVAKIKGHNTIEKNVDAILLGDYLAYISSPDEDDHNNNDSEWSS